MADTSGVLARLQAALSVYDPTWDVTVGSATYKILESVATEIANASNNTVLQTYSYDVNTQYGQDLDTFCNLFGVYRQLGKRASGTVTFYTSGSSAVISLIPIGTQVAVPINTSNNITTAVYFSTLEAAIIQPGGLSIDVPVVATLPGTVGNVAAGAITTMVNSIVGVNRVINAAAFTGGVDPESDAAFRNRWTNTAFNNTTGTFGKYVVTALQDNNVGRANAIGQQNYWDEQSQVQATLSGGSGNFYFNLVAYSGMTNLISNSGYTTPTVVASSGFSYVSTGNVVTSGLNALISSQAPGYNVVVSSTTTTGTVSAGFNISFSNPSPYRLMIGSGTAFSSIPTVTVTGQTVSGVNYYEWIQSNNPDLGISGTMSYINNNAQTSGFLFPQGNELIGSNLNTSSQITYSNNIDYYYPSNLIPQLKLNIANGTNNPSLFIGNNIEMISEYCPASSRSTTIASGNYVDVFIDGTSSVIVQEQSVYNPLFTLSGGASSPPYLNLSNYIVASGASAALITSISGDIYIPFDQQPLNNFPSQLNASNSGVADTIYVYNNTTGSGCYYPIALNPYLSPSGTAYTTFTGAIVSGMTSVSTTFIPVIGASGFLYPGMALANSVATSGSPFYIKSVSSSGITLNNNVTGTYTAATGVVISGKTLAYPLYDVTDSNNSILSMNGIVFDNAATPSGWPALPTALSWVTYNHGYNSDVAQVDSLTQQSRPIGVNALVHQATFVSMIINLTLVLSQGTGIATAQSDISNQITQYFSNIGYNSMISFSNIATQVLSAGGVSNVRVNSINTTAIDGTILTTQTKDFNLASNQLPVLYDIVYTYKGSSNF